MWKPVPSDLQWCQNLVDSLKDGGIWGSSQTGVYRIDKKGKTLTLLSRSPDFTEVDFRRNVVAFRAIGYTVKELP